MGLFDGFKGISIGQKKQVSRLPLSSSRTNNWSILPNTERDYRRTVGNGLGNSIVVSVVNWAGRNFPEAPVALSKREDTNNFEMLFEHDFLDLIENPNSEYSSKVLWKATVIDYNTTGNAYWWKARNKLGKVVELWFLPSSIVEPKGDDSGRLDYYEYTPVPATANDKQIVYKVPKEDIIHFKDSLDPTNTLKGFSAFASVLREVYTDDEAANFSASILGNMAIPGVILSPAVIPGQWDQVQIDGEEIKKKFKRQFGGDRRGEPMVLSDPMDIRVLSWSPTELDLKTIRYIPEERICAVIGIHPSVIGLGSGLERSTFTNYKDAKEAAYESNIIPTQAFFAEELKRKLLPEFVNKNDLRNYKVWFDRSNVSALLEDQNKKTDRVIRMLASGMALVSEARIELGMPVDDSHKVYLRTVNQVPIPEEKGNDPFFINEIQAAAMIPGPVNQSIVEAHADPDLPDLPFPDDTTED